MREVPPDIHGTTSSETKLRRKENGRCTAECSDRDLEQLESVLDSEAAERIYIDSNIVQDYLKMRDCSTSVKKRKEAVPRFSGNAPYFRLMQFENLNNIMIGFWKSHRTVY